MAADNASPGRFLQTEGVTFEAVASLYDFGLPIVTLGRGAAMHRLTADALAPCDGERILDVGCGTGLLTAAIGGRMRSGEVVGVDASRAMLDVARRKRGSGVCRYELALAERLPFEDGSFDAAASSLFFHHLPPELKTRCAAEITRVLRPGGRVAVADFDRPWTAFGGFYEWVASRLARETEIRESAQGILAGLLACAGLVEIASVRGILGCIGIFTARKPA